MNEMPAYLTLTPENARASAWDAGTISMQSAGRSRWNEADARAACEKLCQLWRYINPEIAAAYARDLGVAL